MSDFLSIIRDAIAANESIEIVGDVLAIGRGRVEIPLSANTFYKSQKGTGPYYTVAQVWHFYRLRELVHAKYVSEIGTGGVSYVDRKDLLSYILSEISSSKSIKPFAAASSTDNNNNNQNQNQNDSAVIAPHSPVATADSFAAAVKSVRFADSVIAVATDGAINAESVASLDKPPTANMSQKRASPSTTAAASTAVSPPGKQPSKRSRSAAATAAQADAEADAVADTPMDAAEQEALKLTRAIENNERRLRNRKSVLQTQVKKNGQPFFAPMLATAKKVQKIDAMRRQLAEREQQNEKIRQRPTAYDRYNVREDQFWQERISDAQELGIDTTGTFAGGLADDVNANSAAASAAKAAEARATAQRRETEKARAADKAQKAKAELEHVPIIIVPDSVGPLTIVNARKFLESGVYEPPVKPDTPVAPVQRFQRNDAIIEVRSSSAATRLKDDEWRERVCCVVAQGTEWQFRGWFHSEPVQLFSAVRGVVFRFDDEKANATVLSWSVFQAVLSRSKPHLNKTCFMKFWQEIDRWAQRRPKLKMK